MIDRQQCGSCGAFLLKPQPSDRWRVCSKCGTEFEISVPVVVQINVQGGSYEHPFETTNFSLARRLNARGRRQQRSW